MEQGSRRVVFNGWIGDPSKVEHLKTLEQAEERLLLCEANLLKEGSFDPVVDGCDVVFHTASPVILDNVNDPQPHLTFIICCAV